jgi:hypothetical protein
MQISANDHPDEPQAAAVFQQTRSNKRVTPEIKIMASELRLCIAI